LRKGKENHSPTLSEQEEWTTNLSIKCTNKKMFEYYKPAIAFI